jgi:hypothetical protein
VEHVTISPSLGKALSGKLRLEREKRSSLLFLGVSDDDESFMTFAASMMLQNLPWHNKYIFEPIDLKLGLFPGIDQL